MPPGLARVCFPVCVVHCAPAPGRSALPPFSQGAPGRVVLGGLASRGGGDTAPYGRRGEVNAVERALAHFDGLVSGRVWNPPLRIETKPGRACCSVPGSHFPPCHCEGRFAARGNPRPPSLVPERRAATGRPYGVAGPAGTHWVAPSPPPCVGAPSKPARGSGCPHLPGSFKRGGRPFPWVGGDVPIAPPQATGVHDTAPGCIQSAGALSGSVTSRFPRRLPEPGAPCPLPKARAARPTGPRRLSSLFCYGADTRNPASSSPPSTR